MKTLSLKKYEDRRLREGHLWIYSNEVDTAGFRLVEFVRKPELNGYYAQFEAEGQRPEPAAIKPCVTAKGKTGSQ